MLKDQIRNRYSDFISTQFPSIDKTELQIERITSVSLLSNDAVFWL